MTIRLMVTVRNTVRIRVHTRVLIRVSGEGEGEGEGEGGGYHRRAPRVSVMSEREW